MNRKQKIIICVTGIFIVLFILIGLTYAYFLTQIKDNKNDKSISITTANLELVYGDNSEEIITGTGAIMPVVGTDVNDAIGTKTFTVTNKGDKTNYIVIIDNVSITKTSDGSTTTFVSNDFRYTLTCSVQDKDGNALSGEKCNDVNTLSIFPINGGIIVGNDIEEDRVHEYTLTLWYIDTGENQSDDMGKSYQARVNIADFAQIQNPFATGVEATDNASLAYNIVNNAKLNKNGTKLLNSPLTIVAKETTDIHNTGKYKILKMYYTSWEEGGYDWEGLTYGSSQEIADDGYYDEETDEYIDPSVIEVPEESKAEDVCNSVIGQYISDLYHCNYDGCDSIGKVVACDENGIPTLEENYYLYEEEILEEVNEKTLSITPDDFGTSYYFRGDVKDNYVTFAGMCWRIVRIAGDGSIKLILEDQYTTCDDNETEITPAIYTGNWNIGLRKYGLDGSNKTTSGNTVRKMSYLEPVNEAEDSMVKAFYDFQTTKLADYTGNLKSGDWCLGDTAYTRNGSSGSYTYTLLEDTSNYYLLNKPFYYDAYTRLSGENVNGYQPTLKCNGTILNKFENVTSEETIITKDAPMYVSAITADEIVFAGGKYGSNNENYYLKNNVSTFFLSLSPAIFSPETNVVSYDSIFAVQRVGSVRDIGVYTISALRPVVSLKPGTTIIEGGEGTIENPYVIE